MVPRPRKIDGIIKTIIYAGDIGLNWESDRNLKGFIMKNLR